MNLGFMYVKYVFRICKYTGTAETDMRLKGRRRPRRAVAPIIAELILISITITLGASLSGYFFGLINSFTSPALVMAQGATCTNANPGVMCTVTLANQGAGIVETSRACSIGGSGGVLTVVQVVPGSGTATAVCTTSAGSVSSGGQVSGTLFLSNGMSVYFAART